MYLATHTECENREKHLKNRSVTNTSQSTWPLKTEAIPNVYFAKMSNADFNLSKYTYTSRLKLILSESDFYAFCRAALSKSAKFCFFSSRRGIWPRWQCYLTYDNKSCVWDIQWHFSKNKFDLWMDEQALIPMREFADKTKGSRRAWLSHCW